MGEKAKKAGKLIAFALAASMLFQSAALAAPLDELNAILEKQEEVSSKSMLGEQLGLEELGKAMAEGGGQVTLHGGLMDGTLAALMLTGEYPEDAYCEFNTQIDTKLKKWLFEAEAGLSEEPFGSFSLYGDPDLLALSVPQLYAGAVALRSGNLREQYTNSELSMLLGQPGESVPDLDMTFYPEFKEDVQDEPFGGFTKQMEEKAQLIEENMQVDKTEADGLDVYAVHMQTEDVLEIYGSVLEMYADLFVKFGLTEDELKAYFDQVDVMLGQMKQMLGEEIVVNFYVQDEMLKKLDYELVLDTSVIEQMETEYAPAEQPLTEEDGVRLNANLETADFTGVVNYELVFADPADPWQEFDIAMTMSELEGEEAVNIEMKKQTTETDTTSETTLSMNMAAGGEVMDFGNLFTCTYDASTGDFDAVIEVKDPETEQIVRMVLDSTFTEVETGKCFRWIIDRLAMEAEEEAVGVTADLYVSADPGKIGTPQEQRVLFEMSQAGIMGLMTEISANVEALSAAAQPEIQAE